MAKLVNKKQAIEDPNKLTGPEKAAVILLALGEEHTALWERLDDEEVKEISQAMATLGNVSAEAVEALMIEFVSGLSGSGAVMGSYEQTLRLFGQFLSVREIERTEEVKRVHIESYIDYLQKRGKYTVCAIDAPANSNNPENRSDYVKKISPTTINNYMRNMKVFFNWCVEQELIRRLKSMRTAR